MYIQQVLLGPVAEAPRKQQFDPFRTNQARTMERVKTNGGQLADYSDLR
jgi:hypothetical protein